MQALYHAVLSRPARPDELKNMLTYLDKQAQNPNQGYRDLHWALINTAEFVLIR